MNKKLYNVFGLINPKQHRANVRIRLEEYRRNGTFTENEYKEMKRDRRRQGKTTDLIMQAINAFMQNKVVVMRVMNSGLRDGVKQQIHQWMPYMLNHRNFHLLIGTQAGHELHDIAYDVLLDDDKSYWR